MTIQLSTRPIAEPQPSLGYKLGISGHITFLHMDGFDIAAEDNEEPIQVYVVKKRQLHVVTDADLRIQAIRDEELPERVSGLRLSAFPI